MSIRLGENQSINRINFNLGVIENAPITARHLLDLQGYFLDEESFNAAARENPVIYTLSTVEFAQGEGQLHCGLGTLMPGKIGSEYFFTRGHLHTWRAAAEVYLGLTGEGLLLLEHENGQSEFLPLAAGLIVYVPGYTAHRTINTGETPLSYLGIYPAQAGHDYAAIKATNFQHLVVEIDGQPQLVDRKEYILRTIQP